MSRLPKPGEDGGTWGTILNQFLAESHNADGTLKASSITAVGAYLKPGSGIPVSDLDSSSQAGINAASTAVQSINNKTGTSVSLSAGDIGLDKVENTSDANKPVSTAQQTEIDKKLTKNSNLGDVASADAARANLGVAIQAGVRVVSTLQTTLSGAQTIDNVAVVAGDRVLCIAQTTGSQNGIWVVAAGAWTRPGDFASGLILNNGRSVSVLAGAIYANAIFSLATNPVTVDTTIQSWTRPNTRLTVSASRGGGMTAYEGDSIFSGSLVAAPVPYILTALSNGALTIVSNTSVFGSMTDACRDRIRDTVIPTQRPDNLIFSIGHNEALQMLPVQTWINTMKNIFDICKANGVRPFPTTLFPMGGGALDAGIPDWSRKMNAALRKLCYQEQVTLLEIRQGVEDPATGYYLGGYSIDATHPHTNANLQVATNMWNQLKTIVPQPYVPIPTYNSDATNLFTNPLFQTAPGGIPTGWRVANITGTAPAPTLITNDTDFRGNCIEVTMPAGTAGRYEYVVPTTGLAVGQQHLIGGRIKIISGPNSDKDSYVAQAWGNYLGNSAPIPLITASPVNGMTISRRIISSTTAFTGGLVVNNAAGSASSIVVRYGDVFAYNLSAYETAQG